MVLFMKLKNGKTLGHPQKPLYLKAQQGIATILVVVLLGVSMTAMALGLIYSIRGSQEKQVTVHASTHAQVGLWSGVEAFRRYLGSITEAELLALDGVAELTINLGGNYGSISAKDITVVANSPAHDVSVTIVNVHGDAKASSAVGVMFQISPSTPEGLNPVSMLNFYDSLNITGQITFLLEDGDGARVNVDGDVVLTNVNVPNLAQIGATGSVTADSEVSVDLIHSAGNVFLTGKAYANTVLTEGEFETGVGSDASADVIWANGAITLATSKRSESANSLQTITVLNGSHGKLRASGDISLSSVVTIDSIKTKQNMTVVSSNGGTTLASVTAEGNIRCPSGGWGSITSLAMNGTADPDCGTWSDAETNAGITVTAMEPVTPFSMPPVVIDARALKVHANYVFEYDEAVSRTKVTVFNIGGVTNPDGEEFYLGNYKAYDDEHNVHHSPRLNYLCTAFDNEGFCTAPAGDGFAICVGHSNYNECVDYTDIVMESGTTTKGWVFNGIAAAPGIMWFEGSVELNNGKNYTTIIATGNVKTGGGLNVYSVNYGGYAGICDASTYGHTDYLSRFENQFPTNLCDNTTSPGTYTPIPTGNIGIIAGSYSTDSPPVFSGGEVELGSSNKVHGAVLAGQSLNTSGQTEVYGYVTAAAQGGKVAAGTRANSLAANTTIDLTTTVDTYDPTGIPMEITPEPIIPVIPGADTDYREKSKILWSRYL